MTLCVSAKLKHYHTMCDAAPAGKQKLGLSYSSSPPSVMSKLFTRPFAPPNKQDRSRTTFLIIARQASDRPQRAAERVRRREAVVVEAHTGRHHKRGGFTHNCELSRRRTSVGSPQGSPLVGWETHTIGARSADLRYRDALSSDGRRYVPPSSTRVRVRGASPRSARSLYAIGAPSRGVPTEPRCSMIARSNRGGGRAR